MLHSSIIVLITIVLASCQNSNSRTKGNNSVDANKTLAKMDQLLFQLDGLDANDCNAIDRIVEVNEKLRREIENLRLVEELDYMVDAHDPNSHEIGLIVSDDGNFALFSWQTKMECLGQSIKNIAVFKSKNQLRISSLYGKPMLYSRISQVKETTGNNIYLLHSQKTKDTQNIIMGYTISNGILAEAQISNPIHLQHDYAISEMEDQ